MKEGSILKGRGNLIRKAKRHRESPDLHCVAETSPSKPKRPRPPRQESAGAVAAEPEPAGAPKAKQTRSPRRESPGVVASESGPGGSPKPRRSKPPRQESAGAVASEPEPAGTSKPKQSRPPRQELAGAVKPVPAPAEETKPRRKRPKPESEETSEAKPTPAGTPKPKRERPPKPESTGATASEPDPAEPRKPRRPKSKPESAGATEPEPDPAEPRKPRRPKPKPESAGAEEPKPSRKRPKPESEGARKPESAPAEEPKPRRKRPKPEPEGGPKPQPTPAEEPKQRRKRPKPESTDPSLTKEPELRALSSREQSPDPIAQKANVMRRLDITIITVLWTFEIVHTTIDRCLAKYMAENFDNRDRSRVSTSTGQKWGFIVVSLIFMIFMGLFLTLQPKNSILRAMEKYVTQHQFLFMFGGIAIYSFSAVVGILLSLSRNVAVAIVMAWMEVSWYAVHPIRFWYIFHQVFPISVRWSHLLVSGNLLIIGAFEYVVTIFVKDRDVNDPFPHTFYSVAFGILTLACVVWLIGAFFVKRFLNPVPADFNAVREVYARSEVIEEFDRKQSVINFILFPLVMIPALIFPIMDVLIDVGHYYLPLSAVHLDIGFVPYRPHLICFLLTVIIVEAVLQFLKFIKTELINLTVIAISHLLNICVLVLFMYILHNTFIVRLRNPNEGDGIFMLVDTILPKYFTQIGSINIQYSTVYQVIRDVPADGLVPVRLSDRFTGEVYTDEKLQINVSHGLSTNLFHVMNYTGGRLKLVKAPSSPVTYVENTRIIFMNGLEECNNFINPGLVDKLFKANEMRGMLIRNICLPISYLYYPNGTDFKKAIPFKPPANNETMEFETPCLQDYKSAVLVDRPYFGESLTCNDAMVLRYHRLLTYLIRSKIVASPAELIFWPVFFHYDIFKYSLIFSRLEDNWWDDLQRTPVPNNAEMVYFRSEKEFRLILAEMFYGISLGMSAVGYLHLLWMQCPVKFRMLIIFSFFAMIFAASSVAKRHLTAFDENAVFSVLVVAAFCFLWQMAANFMFFVRWMMLTKSKEPKLVWRRH